MKEGADEDLFIAAPLDLSPADAGHSWTLDRCTGSIHRIEDSAAALVPHLGRWRTPAGHVVALAEAGIPSLGPSSMGLQLQELVDEGLLLSWTRFVDAIAREAPRKRNSRIAWVTWCTRDRPAELARSVASYLEHISPQEKGPEILILDDSTRRDMQRTNRDTLRSASPNIQYMAEDEKRVFAQGIVARGDGIDPETTEFALFGLPGAGITTGANRNAQLLATVGDMTLSADDDTLHDFAHVEKDEQRLALSSAMDPTEYRFFRDQAALAVEAGFVSPAILETHLSLLGKSIGKCVLEACDNGHPQALHVEDCSERLVHSLLMFGGIVAATPMGICGDSGLGSARYVLTIGGPSRERLMASDTLYQSAISNRLLLRVVPRTTISNATYFQSTCVGLDNSLSLPPFFPVGRNSEGIFGQLLNTCFPDLLVAHLPLAIRHEPAKPRSSSPDAVTGLPIRLTEIVNTLLLAFESNAAPVPGFDRLEAAGRHFRDLAKLLDKDFLAFVRTRYLPHLSLYVDHLERLLGLYDGKPDFWARDVEAHLSEILEMPKRPDFCVASDLRAGRSLEEAVSLTRQILDRFGDLLESWAEIRAAAGSLRESGKEFSVLV